MCARVCTCACVLVCTCVHMSVCVRASYDPMPPMFEPSALTTPGTRSQPALENLRGARAGKVSEYVVRPGASDSSLTMTAPRELALSAEGLRAAARSCAHVCVCVCECVCVCV